MIFWNNIPMKIISESLTGIVNRVIRQWCLKFGKLYARKLRNKHGIKSDRWFLDEVFLTVNGHLHYLWCVVDQDGEVDILVQKRKDIRATLIFSKSY